MDVMRVCRAQRSSGGGRYQVGGHGGRWATGRKARSTEQKTAQTRKALARRQELIASPPAAELRGVAVPRVASSAQW